MHRICFLTKQKHVLMRPHEQNSNGPIQSLNWERKVRVHMNVIRWLDKHLEESLMIVLLAVITTVMIFQVILRYLFRSPLFWAEEFCRYGLVWSTFISVGYCVRYNINLHVDLLDYIMPPKIKIVVQYLIKLICLLFYVVFFLGSWQYHMQSVAAKQLSQQADSDCAAPGSDCSWHLYGRGSADTRHCSLYQGVAEPGQRK